LTERALVEAEASASPVPSATERQGSVRLPDPPKAPT
jgi:hypothetical protein